MPAWNAASLSTFITISVWAISYLPAVHTKYPTSSLSNVSAATGSFPQPSAIVSCPSGPGRESHQVVNSSGDIWPYQVFKSSQFNPPELEITTDGQPLAPGLLFITPDSTNDTAPLIMTDTGQLIWNGPMTYATNFRVASYEGNSILTYWSGSTSSRGNGYGNVTFLDATYNEILNVCPHFGLVTPDNFTYPCQADLHESFVTDRNTLLVTAYNVTETDLTSVGGPSNGWVLDCLFFELNPKNGDILFRWSALEHVPVSETKVSFAGEGGFTQSDPFDWFHINSVVNIGNHFLVNSRHVWTTYLITPKGDIDWTLQGDTGGDFGTLPSNGKFAWQHNPRPHNITDTSIIISYFNNFNTAFDNGNHSSNGLVLQLALPPNKSSPPVVLEILSDPDDPIYSESQGSTTLLPDGASIVGYGQIPVLKEFRHDYSSGRDVVLWTGRFGFDNIVQSYRGIKARWQGFPTTSPDLVVESNGIGCYVGYVSWNGATNVETWVVYEGRAADRLPHVRRIGYEGFETQFTVGQPCVQVAATVQGEVSARSSVVCHFANETSHD